MKMYSPSSSLMPFVRQYMITEAKEEVVNRVFPNTAITMAFRFRGEVNQVEAGVKNKMPLFLISGLRKSPRLINYVSNAGNIIVHFREGAAAAFVNEPLHELMGESVSLYHLKGYSGMAELEDKLDAAQTDTERIQFVEQFLFCKIQNHKPDHLVLRAVELITQQKGNSKIKQLADTLCISHDAFEKRFRKIAGASPKQFAYLVRMNDIIRQPLTKTSFTDIAFQSGYFDQSHFIKDFKLFTGLTPGEFTRNFPSR